MEEQAFYKTISSIVDDLHENAFGVRILYDMCNDKRHPWGNKFRLADKLCFISRLYNHTLRDGFLIYATHEVGGRELSRHRQVNVFSSIADMLWENDKYKEFVEKISNTSWQFAYDVGSDDIAHFRESLLAVLEFNEILKGAIQRYDELYNQHHTRGDNIPFVSKFLHFHRPEQFFIYDHDIRRGRTNFRSESGCRIGRAIIDGEAKAQIEETCCNVLKSMYDDGVLVEENTWSPKVDYIRSMGLQYAICCYLTQHRDKIDGLNQHAMPLVSAEILTRIRKIKTRKEIETTVKELKPEMPIAELALYCEDEVEFEQIFEEYNKRNIR